MAKKKAPLAAKVEEAVPIVQNTPSGMQDKLAGIAASKRAPLLRGKQAKDLYALMKDMKVKLVLDQPMSIGQYKDGKEPFARFVIAREFRVILDLTEE